MNDAGELPPLLLGLFRELRANGVAVGVRDYLDGLRALRLGHGAGSRQALRELALALWARSEAERRLIARWFDAIPEVPPTLLERVEGVVSTLEESVHAGTSGERSRRTTIPPAVPPPTVGWPSSPDPVSANRAGGWPRVVPKVKPAPDGRFRPLAGAGRRPAGVMVE